MRRGDEVSLKLEDAERVFYLSGSSPFSHVILSGAKDLGSGTQLGL